MQNELILKLLLEIRLDIVQLFLLQDLCGSVTKIPIVYVSLYVDIYFACRYYFQSQKIPTIYVFCM